MGHPEIVIPAVGETDIENYFGMIKCKVLPPKNLYHPVLPYKSDVKLMFPLCKTCCETMQQSECLHTDKQRALTGTWVSEELKVAVKKGYVILKVSFIYNFFKVMDSKIVFSYTNFFFQLYEVYHFKETSETLFRSYIDLFLKIKQEASGWPAECVTDADKERYIASYVAVEGVQLDGSQVHVNPGRRAVAKLALNSFWGRWGMNRNKAHLQYVRTLEDFNKILTDNTKTVSYFSFFPFN